MNIYSEQDHVPIMHDLQSFDRNSGGWLERLIFNHRMVLIIFCAVISVFLGYHASKLEINASYEKMIPQSHPYIQNFFKNRQALPSAGNSVRVVVEPVDGNLFDKDYLLTLQKVNDTLNLLPGVERSRSDEHTSEL